VPCSGRFAASRTLFSSPLISSIHDSCCERWRTGVVSSTTCATAAFLMARITHKASGRVGSHCGVAALTARPHIFRRWSAGILSSAVFIYEVLPSSSSPYCATIAALRVGAIRTFASPDTRIDFALAVATLPPPSHWDWMCMAVGHLGSE
jgi:hypothetical protein